MKDVVHHRWFHALLLLLWVGIGGALRLTHLAAKPPWTDEFATLVFSLGSSFRGVPLDQAMSIETLLQPLYVNPDLGAAAVIRTLFSETVHPPLYFVLANGWMHLFSPPQELASLWVARLLPALLGTAGVAAAFALGRLAFRSLAAAHLAAAMLAVSPFGIFLSQEARHYTLAILWVMASLACLMVAVHHLARQQRLPIWVGLLWVAINAVGIATHYFFLLTLGAIAITLLWLGWVQTCQNRKAMLHPAWHRIYAVAVGTACAGLVWLPLWLGIRSHEVTQWIQTDEVSLMVLINPIFQALAAWVTMIVLLPVESDALPIVIVSGLAMGIFLVWVIPLLGHGLRLAWQSGSQQRLAVQALGGFVLGAIALFFLITYGLSTDLTRGARYNFVYYPAVMVLVGGSLAACWPGGVKPAAGPSAAGVEPASDPLLQPPMPAAPASKPVCHQEIALPLQSFGLGGWRALALVLAVGVFSGLTVVNNLGYRKYYRPDLLVPLIQATSTQPVLIATTHNTHVQTGEMMGIAWVFQHEANPSTAQPASPQVLLAHQVGDRCRDNCDATTVLQRAVEQQPGPFDLWLVNFRAPVEVEAQGCTRDEDSATHINGYSYRLYHCQ